MKNIIPLYPVKILALSSALITFLILNGCSTPPKHAQKVPTPTQPSYAPEVLKTTPPPQIKAEDLITLSETELELQTATAQQQAEWPNFILLNQQLWQTASESEQAQIEQRIWDAISQQPLEAIKSTIQTLKQHPNISVQQWGALLETLKGPAESLQKNLAQLSENNPDAIYMHHLLPGFNMQNSLFTPPKHIAVLLPFEGRYEHVSNQIKNGIMKAFMASDQQTQLTFHNSSDLNNLENLYQQTKQAGADFIIGPLRKEAIDRLITVADEEVLALNRIEYAPFTQFSYKSADEISQFIHYFKAQNYQHIGILSNDGVADSKMAHALKVAWEHETNHRATVSLYPDKKPKLRQALSTLINDDKSKERYDTLRWATGHKLKFSPRTRQDFDAIIIIDNATRMAVFKPQFAFFNLKTPIYGTAQLTPKNPQHIKINRDLAGVKFLTHSVVFQPENLTSNFEAFGWDSFQVATHLHNLKMGGYLSHGKTGELTLKDQLIQQHLIWATYNSKGKLILLIE